MGDNNYIILRERGDIDILSKKSKLKNTIIYFTKKNYINLGKRFYHISIRKILGGLDVIDLQFGGLNKNNLIFLDERYFFDKKYSQKMILNLALFLHLLVNKGEITQKRKAEFFSGFEKLSKKEEKAFFEICQKEYGERIAKKLKKITENKKINIKKLKWEIIFKKSNFLQIIELPGILIKNLIYKFIQKRKKYIISFIGVDGSGKTTSIKRLVRFLEENNIKTETGSLGVYHERTILMKFLSKFIKKEKNEKIAQNKLNINYKRKSFLKNIVRIIDIYLRYKKTLRKAEESKSKIIIFDRYFYDIILQSKLDTTTRVLLKLVPKPDKLFFLYANPKDIYKRKGERSPEVLEEQINKFRDEITPFSKVKEIETKTEKQTLNEILQELNNKRFLSCI